MVAKTASQKILIFLILVTFVISLISGWDMWTYWFILPFTFFFFYLVGKQYIVRVNGV